MNNIVLQPSREVPYFPGVNFDFEGGKCDLYEESYMEEPYKFYKPILEWLKEFFIHKDCLEFNFRLTYFNTSTSKVIVEILEILKKSQLAGKSVTVNWYMQNDDPDMLMEIHDFESDSDIKINITTSTE